MKQTALGVLAIIAAGAVGFGAYRWYDSSKSDAPAAATAHDPSDAAPLPAPSSEPSKIPETLPEFVLKDRAGKARSISEWKGKSLVLNFWATWCGPCRREIPMLTKLNKDRAAQNVVVIGIAVDFREQVIAYADKIGLDYELLIGEQDGLDALGKFGVDAAGFPFTVFTDNEGRIVTAHLGELHDPEAKIILDAVADVNSGKVALEAGQEQIRKGLEGLKAG